MAPDRAPIRIEVVYAQPEEQAVIALSVRVGTTAREALALSGLAARYPELDAQAAPLGIYGRAAADDAVLGDGDRVEVYRRLVADPKQARRRRARRSV